ncbi:MAG TPA: phosphomethylpyrimidine synthase ThiC [Methanosarcinales archaeon]|nr:phosphomethylpyrimidine synthase ThiC [Methanosarcinales archaeon]
MTLLDRARSREITEEIRCVADAEGIDAEKLRHMVASGRVVIPGNICSRAAPVGIGECMHTRINANVGTSVDFADVGEEIEKARVVVMYGADTVMDLSTGGDPDAVLEGVLDAVRVPVGTVPIYRVVCSSTPLPDTSADDLFNAVRSHAERGVDFMTVHAGVNRHAIDCLIESGRIMDVVSRGGALTVAWMQSHDSENPFYAEYDYLLEIAREYDVTLSLGDGMRPGCIADAGDPAMFAEVITLGRLVRRARAAGVQCMVEGPGHVPMNDIGHGVRTTKQVCDFAPLYLLGPLVTDIAPGYDHITGAIGGAIAGMYGADFLCMLTPAEHLALPTIDDIREGTIVTKIAAHAVDLVKPGVRERALAQDLAMALARKHLDWDAQFECAIDGERARSIHEARLSSGDACSMCGELCAIEVMKRALEGRL